MRNLCILVLTFLLLFFTTSCKNPIIGRSEITDLMYIRAFAIDKNQTGDGVQITLLSKESSTGSSAKGQEKKSNILTATGSTVSEAINNFTKFAYKDPYFGHAEYILIGEDLAREGILPYLDYVSSDYEFRLNEKIYIVNGSTASDVITKGNTSDMFVDEILKSLETNATKHSISSKVKLAESMNFLENPYVSAYLPCITLTNSSLKDGENKPDIMLKGYSVFKKDKLFIHLSETQAKGLNWLRNLFASSFITVKGPAGEKISLEVIDSKVKFIPQISNNQLSCKIKVSITSNISEIMGTSDVFNEESINNLESQQEQIVKSDIEETINLAQNIKMDFFGMASHFHMRHPMKWETISENWAENKFPKINFSVEVESKIARTYLLKQPTGSKQE